MIWNSTEYLQLCITWYVNDEGSVSCLEDIQNEVCSQCCPIVESSIVPSSQVLSKPIQLRATAPDQNVPKQPSNILKGFKKVLVPLSSLIDPLSPPTPIPTLHSENQEFSPQYTKCSEESEPPFVKELRTVKKRKINTKLTTQEYVVRLKHMVQAMDGNCTVCIVNNPDLSEQHDHIANYCPHLDFCVFLK